MRSLLFSSLSLVSLFLCLFFVSLVRSWSMDRMAQSAFSFTLASRVSRVSSSFSCEFSSPSLPLSLSPSLSVYSSFLLALLILLLTHPVTCSYNQASFLLLSLSLLASPLFLPGKCDSPVCMKWFDPSQAFAKVHGCENIHLSAPLALVHCSLALLSLYTESVIWLTHNLSLFFLFFVYLVFFFVSLCVYTAGLECISPHTLVCQRKKKESKCERKSL